MVAESLTLQVTTPSASAPAPPKSGGELCCLGLPSSDEEGWRAERRGGLTGWRYAGIV